MPFSLPDIDETEDERSSSNDYGFLKPPKGRMGKVLAAYSFGTAAYSSSKKIYDWYNARRRLTVTISAKDPLYATVVEWLQQEAFGGNSKSVALISGRVWDEAEDGYLPGKLRVVHNAHQRQSVEIKGHKISVQVQDEETTVTTGNAIKIPTSPKVVFTTYSTEAHQVLIDTLVEMYNSFQKTVRPPKLYRPSGWGGFRSDDSLPPRSLDSVILKKGELNFLVDDLKTFLNSETDYNRLGLPWHRGYLFYGDVGTGKTSIAKAIAAHFGLDVFMLPLGDIKKDGELTKLLVDIKPRSILLIEDIDVFSAATDRKAGKEEVSLSGLLNALDGISTPHGMVTIMTTNKIEELDEALIRPGRVDVKQEFTALSQEQGEHLFRHFYKEEPGSIKFDGLSPSSVVGVFKQNLNNAQGARRILKSKVRV